MAEINVHEPPTAGRVRVKTNKGDLVIDLWSRECPKACRNFVQLCMEGFYHGCIFFRVIHDFLVQTGDPSNTGSQSESVWGEAFPDEVQPRLRYRYRGLVGVASQGSGSNSNGSQFFITLSRQDPLNGQHTLFGKLVGDSVYVLADIGDVEVDKNDRPLGEFPPVILETIVLDNPFPDIVPRTRKAPFDPNATSRRAQPLTKQRIFAKKTNVLSFEHEEEITSDEVAIKSAHDLGGQLSRQTYHPGPMEESQQKAPRAETEAHAKTIHPVETEVSVPPEVTPRTMKTSIQSEIERLTAAIRAAEQAAAQPTGNKDQLAKKHTLTRKAVDRDDESKIVSKLKLWGSAVSKSKRARSDLLESERQETSSREESSTLHSLISSAEGGSVNGSDWLKSAGPVKFAIDSKNAFSR
jgi:peptidyl-prolyl cis-trans isomerase SDCCAG10